MKKNGALKKLIFYAMRGTVIQMALILGFAGNLLAKGADGQELLDKKITLTVTNQLFKNVLQKIEKATKVKFAYTSQVVFLRKKASVNANNERLGDVLNRIFGPVNISYEVVGKQIILRNNANAGEPVNADDKPNEFIRISGQVRSGKDNTPLAGVSISVKGTQRGTVTNADGYFEIEANDGEVLVISAVGYVSQEVAASKGAGLDIHLLEANKDLGEVVVTALGISKQKRQLGFAVTELKGSELAKTNEVNPINALQGKVAGVQIDEGAGGLFGSTKILIRGNSTLGNNNQPIFVVDGVIMDNDIFNGNGRDFGNDLKNLNPEDFETVSVLRGSSAAALYGSRAINGVILITTKKGTARKGIGVTVNETYNIQDPYKGPKFQNDFGGGTVGAFFTDTRDPNYQANQSWTTKVFPTDPITGKPYIDRGINRELENWGPRMQGQQVENYDGTMTTYSPQPNNFLQSFQTGTGSNTNVALEGGTEKSTFRLSYNHNLATGITFRNKFTKDAFDFRGTQNFNKFISADVSVAYSDFDGQNPPSFGDLFTWLIPRNYNTDYWIQRQHYTSIFGGVPDLSDPNDPNKAPQLNQWFTLFENTYQQKEQMVRGRIALTMNLASWAKLVLDGSLNNIYTRKETSELGQGKNFSGGSYSLGFTNKTSNFLKAMLMMNKDINKDLSINGYIGAEAQRYKTYFDLNSTDGGLNYPGNYYLANSVNPPLAYGGVSSRKSFNSVYASADLAYKNLLFLQATFRGDWSSALTYTNGSGNNFYNYPAVSLSWIFSESLRLPSWISFGKLRGNVASLGKDTDPFIINSGFSFNGFTYANGTTLPTSTYSPDPNNPGVISVLQPNLKPERKLSEELGLEMRFLHNRVGFDLSVYQDNTKDQIIPITSPQESGVNSILINAGNVQNRGIEIAVDATPVRTKNFSWNSALTYSKNQNKIIALAPGRTELDLGANIGEISTWAVVGGSYGQLRTTIHSTAFEATDAGGNKINDPRNGLPILTWRSDARAAFPARSNVWQTVGDINPKFRAGFNNTFTYKSFSLNILLDAKIGGDYVLLTYRYGTHTGVFPNTLAGRDAKTGGISWTSAFDGITYDDGMIPKGVFPAGQMVTKADGSQVDVSGLTYKEAYDKGYVEPTHTPQFFYRYGSSSTGVSDYWVLKNSWISLRQVALSYNLPKNIY
ncbi:MAG: SusC/RagA family TonB-linked outer membrane protein, partial [Bacteroidota bacterium]|nr:SusC/RagA family TonB-linked outer membrane protein [Bacteroidota bacterium]